MPDIHTFLMMGRPGSGKGTQGKLLAQKLGAELYSSGNRLREMAKGEGYVAHKVRDVLNGGDLLPAWFSSHLFVEALLGLGREDPIIFEGACRRLEEAQAFDQTAGWLERPYRAIFLNISDQEVEKRLDIRRGVAGRADDASDTVEHRLHEYADKTAPAVNFFRERGILVEIDAEGTIEEVRAKVLGALGLN